MKRPTGVTMLAVLSFLSAGVIILLSPLVLARGAALTNLAAGRTSNCNVGTRWHQRHRGVSRNCRNLCRCRSRATPADEWARLLLITLVILGAIAAVVGLVSSFSPFEGEIVLGRSIGLLINVGILFYLFDRSVKEAFTKRSAS